MSALRLRLVRRGDHFSIVLGTAMFRVPIRLGTVRHAPRTLRKLSPPEGATSLLGGIILVAFDVSTLTLYPRVGDVAWKGPPEHAVPRHARCR